MKKLATILLIKLMLLPILWNGVGLLHYVVEHTHTFCTENSTEHSNHDAKDCVSICQLVNTPSDHQIPANNDYYELKTCLTPNPFLNTLYDFSIKQTNFNEPFPLDNLFANDIFQPPIS